MADAMRDLCGAPGSSSLICRDEGKTFANIEHAIKNKHLVSASTPAEKDGEDEYKKMGLSSHHAYSVLDAKTVQVDGEDVRLLKCFNPWGHFEWNGAWSDKSDKWTPELKQICGVEDKDDGSFWMQFEDFEKYFTHTSISKYYDGFAYQSDSVMDEMAMHVVKVTTPGRYFFSTQ